MKIVSESPAKIIRMPKIRVAIDSDGITCVYCGKHLVGFIRKNHVPHPTVEDAEICKYQWHLKDMRHIREDWISQSGSCGSMEEATNEIVDAIKQHYQPEPEAKTAPEWLKVG